jgi:hypothetical protein
MKTTRISPARAAELAANHAADLRGRATARSLAAEAIDKYANADDAFAPFHADEAKAARRAKAARAMRNFYAHLSDRSPEASRALSQIRALESRSEIPIDDLRAWARRWRTP